MAMLSEETKKVFEANLGLPYEQLCGLDMQDEIAFVKEKTGSSPRFIHDSRKIVRGNALLAQGKITTMDEINKKIDTLRT